MVTLEAVLGLARQLSPIDQVRLIEQLAPHIEQALAPSGAGGNAPSWDLWGLLADLGAAPSAEEIDEARREAWANFPHGDV
jgi:hypothetical protein